MMQNEKYLLVIQFGERSLLNCILFILRILITFLFEYVKRKVLHKTGHIIQYFCVLFNGDGFKVGHDSSFINMQGWKGTWMKKTSVNSAKAYITKNKCFEL